MVATGAVPNYRKRSKVSFRIAFALSISVFFMFVFAIAFDLSKLGGIGGITLIPLISFWIYAFVAESIADGDDRARALANGYRNIQY